MSKQQQAPGQLELVRRFVNTLDVERDEEALTTPAAFGTWLREAGLSETRTQATKADLARAIQLREALRQVLMAHNEGRAAPLDAVRTLDAVAARARIRLRFDASGAAVLAPEAKGVDGALGRLLAIVQDAIAQGTWRRLKACRWHTCEWAFYDRTKNRSGAWCNMDVCGNRAKARAYRERHAAA